MSVFSGYWQHQSVSSCLREGWFMVNCQMMNNSSPCQSQNIGKENEVGLLADPCTSLNLPAESNTFANLPAEGAATHSIVNRCPLVQLD